LFFQHTAKQFFGHFRSVRKNAARMPDPLPDLSSRDFRRSGILHKVEDRNAAGATQPGFQVLDAHTDVRPQALLGNRFLGPEFQNISRGDLNIFTLSIDLIRVFITASNAAKAVGTNPGCATQVPSCPSFASRSLSARTFAEASWFAVIILSGNSDGTNPRIGT
jgi:hypothetical protein